MPKILINRIRSYHAFVWAVLLLLASAEVVAQNGVTRVYTDYNGYWTSSSTAINAVKPDNSHNLLGFIWNGVTYSTGVNNALLTTKGVSFSATNYQAFPVKNVALPGTNSNFVGLGQLYDGVDNGGSSTPPFSIPADISRLLTDGPRGLDLGICVTNIPASASALTFTFGGITDPAQINDGTPDILISQVAAPDNTSDQVYFEDKSGNRIGSIVSINESTTAVPSVGNWTADFYNPNTGVIAPGFIKTDRPIRIWAADASLFGLTASNYKDAAVLRYKLGGSSDPAFLAFNTAFIQPVSANDDAALTDVGVPVSLSVLANDVPTGGLTVSSLTITSAPANGTATVNPTTGVVTYTPKPGFSGIDRFFYQVCNAAGQCDDAQVTITIGSADLLVEKTVSASSPAKGSTISFVIKATNKGPNEATGVVVNDVLPSGYAFVSASTNQYSSNTGNWTIGTLANAATTSLTITATVNETGTYSNTATISGTKQDPVSTNNTAIASATPISVSDRAVTKVASTTAPVVGSVISFTVTATNIGPSVTTGVRVNDLLPAGYSLEAATPSTGMYTSSTGLWIVGSLAKNGVATLVINATVRATGPYTNTATISGTEDDPVVSNNTATVTPVPTLQADLLVVKTVDNSTPGVGAGVVFTVVATNNGPSPATGVSVKDALPSGYAFQSATPSAGTYTAGSGTWSIGNLTSGQSVTLTVNVRVNPSGTYANVATIQGDQLDPVGGNNTSTVTPVPVAQADLAITKTLDNVSLNDGKAVFTITVTNRGPSTGTNVTVTDIISDGYTYVSSTASVGSYSAASGTWQINTLPSSSTVTLTLSTSLNASGTYSNTATVSSAETDPVSANNSATVSPEPLPPTTTQPTQRFCETAHPTLADLEVAGRAVNWYATATGGSALSNSTTLVTNTTYYATQTIVGYESVDRLAVTAVLDPVASAGPDQTLLSSTFILSADPGPGSWQVVSVTPSSLTSEVIITDPALYNTTVTVPNMATAVLSWTADGSLCSDEVTLINTKPNVPDLTPIIYVRPSTINGTTTMNVIVDIVELNSIATNGLITIKITKDPMISLTFNTAAGSVGGQLVQNSGWTFDDTSDKAFYLLTTTQVIQEGGRLRLGLNGVMRPGATSGSLTLSSMIIGGAGGEERVTNNGDADKIDYFEN